ncbi:MAG: MATE family efflux transporter [Lachnospiraceae bacterium]|nr:MATE family efflux transporter [Lachnospiraceae bacterium]
MNTDLTKGKPERVLWKFCLPLFGSVLFQQLYNIADSLVAGKFCGETALAAVGNSYEITLIFIAFAFGCNMGCSIVVSRLFGAKEYRNMKTAVFTTFISSGILCFLLMTFGFLLSDRLLNLIHTPKEIFYDSRLYLDIYILGLPFLFFYNIATGIFSALGDSKTPFKFLAISSTANILADILFVHKFHLNVAGVAWATFICQGVSCICSIVVVIKRLDSIKTEKKAKLFSFPILKDIIAIAVPSTLQQSFVSVGNIFIQGFINGFGPGVIAGYASAIKLNNLVVTSFSTIGNGISNYTAQNVGAKTYDRIYQGFKAGIKMVITLCLPIMILYLVFSKQLINFFINNPSELALNSGIDFLHVVAPFYFCVALKLTSDAILRGSNHMNAFMIATFTDLLLRVVLAKVFSSHFGYIGIWYAWPVGWIIATAMSVVMCIKVVKKLEKDKK